MIRYALSLILEAQPDIRLRELELKFQLEREERQDRLEREKIEKQDRLERDKMVHELKLRGRPELHSSSY